MEETIIISKKTYDEVLEAMEHCVKVFRSMSDRGAYPRELCPFKIGPFAPGEDIMGEEPLFLGKQGFMFLIEAINKLKGESQGGVLRVRFTEDEKSMLRNGMRSVELVIKKLDEFEFKGARNYAIGARTQLQKLASKVHMNGVGIDEDE